MKMIKDKKVTVRVNSEIREVIRASGMTLQKVVDNWIKRNISVDTQTKTKIKLKR